MRSILQRGLAATAVTAVTGALLIGGASGASAFAAGPLAKVANGNSGLSTGTNFDSVKVTAPAACDAAATRHTTIVTSVVATNPAQQASVDPWAGKLLYSPIAVGLPGPITDFPSNGSWQQIADAFGLPLVAGTYNLTLQCQNNLGTSIFEQWTGVVNFSTPLLWSVPAAPLVPTTTTVTATPQPVTAGSNVTLTATVTETNPAAPTGNVDFKNGATVIGSAPVNASGVATFTGPLAAGTYTISAVYAGDAVFATSTGTVATAFVVTPAPAAGTSTALAVSPTSGAAFQSVTATGTVTNTSNAAVIPVGSCTFKDGATVLGTSALSGTGVCTYTASSFSGPGHSFTVDFVPANAGLFSPSTSAAVTASYSAPQFTPDEQTIVVTVPTGNLTIFTPYTPAAPLNLGNLTLSANGTTFGASAAFNKVTITDTRAGNPGWTAALTRADFIGANPANTIPAKYSGFTAVTGSYTAGNAIQAGDVTFTDIPANSPTYVAGPATFASTVAGKGTGTVDITANFVLAGVPTSTAPGLYTATVVFTIA